LSLEDRYNNLKSFTCCSDLSRLASVCQTVRILYTKIRKITFASGDCAQLRYGTVDVQLWSSFQSLALNDSWPSSKRLLMLQHAIIHLHACTFVSVSIEKRIPRSFAIYSFRAGCVVVESSTLMRGERKVCVEDQQGILQRHPACYSPDDRWTRLAAGVAFVLSVSLGNQIC
jgi:hypothetical protein